MTRIAATRIAARHFLSRQMRRLSMVAFAAFIGIGIGPTLHPAYADDGDAWPDLQTALFADKPIKDGSAFLQLEAPKRAYDAAVVPLEIKFDPQKMGSLVVQDITLVIDKNPAPLAAIFHLAPGVTNPSIGTRIRVNEYTYVHAVVQMTDGQLYMSKTFIKAAGGCSAPAVKTPDSAASHLGEMKMKLAEAPAVGQPTRVQLLIHHPNFSGMQMDQVTRYYIPAKYIQTATISYGDKPVMKIEGNISLSENPFFEFWLKPEQSGALDVTAEDSDGAKFHQKWPLPPTT
ncbi:MAG TPA: quinoprotein dehydrogenase-associated SoxYZ-like carrier [Terriglobia bacterium]|nr:quinoprotein dehydrogenase-associated SoxYZ-like carrier [Terriglobia bacterium]